MIYVQLENTLKKSWITLKQSLNTKIITFHGLLIKFSNKFSKFHSIPPMKKGNSKNIHQLSLPYQWHKCWNIIKSMNKCANKLLPNNTKTEVAFKRTKLSSCFNAKDKINFEQNHDLIYHAKWPEPTCIDNYVGESAHQITENQRSCW